MASYVYDNLASVETKSDSSTPSGDTTKMVTATDINSHTTALSDLRTSVLRGNYHGLVTNPTASLSTSGNAVIRQNAGVIQGSANGDIFRRFTEPTIFYSEDYGSGAAGIQAAINAVTTGSSTMGGTVIQLPAGTITVTSEIAIANKLGVTLRGAGMHSTVLQASGAGMNGKDIIKITNSPFTEVSDMCILGQSSNTPRSGIAFLQDSGTSTSYGQIRFCKVSRVRVGIDNTNFCQYGFYTGGDTDQNNDFHSFRDCMVYNASVASFKALNSQSVDHTFSHCYFNNSATGVDGPGWTWLGGAIGGNTTADFAPGVGPCRIFGGNSEGSARFITTSNAPGVAATLIVIGFRWSADAAAAGDNYMIQFYRAGPLIIQGCRFDTSNSRVSKIDLSAIYNASIFIKGNVWNQPGADAVSVVNWSAAAGGNDYPGGIFRGSLEDNIYVDSNSNNLSASVGARASEAIISGSSGNPTQGQWRVGDRFRYITPAAGGYLGKVCTSAGTAASAWGSGTSYSVGVHVTNDSGKVYECITSGTSAGSGGPTGTGSNITDNTAHWKYVDVLATFKGFAAIEA